MTTTRRRRFDQIRDRAQISDLVDPLRAQFAAWGATPSEAFQLTLVLDEILTNIVDYGYPDGPVGSVSLRLALRRGVLAAEVIDDGAAFNPLDRPPPDLDDNVETRRIGGLGVHFLTTMTDRRRYRRVDGRNRLRMLRRLGQTDDDA